MSLPSNITCRYPHRLINRHGTFTQSTNTNYFPPYGFNSTSVVYGIAPIKLKPLLNPSKRLCADRQIMKLSVGLAATYNAITKKYHDDCELRKKGHYSFASNEIIYGRYQLKKRVGMGSSGQVFEAIDMHNNRRVAVKIYRAKKGSTMQAKKEIKLLTEIKEDEMADEKHIVQILDSFALNGHQCVVLEPLNITLLKLIKEAGFRGVSLGLVRTIATQLLNTLDYLARKEIVHSDLKPENCCLRDANCSYIKLIDFASACKSTETTYTYIQSRFYRSPEVILKLSYGVSIDMWSLGCMLVELYTGEILFAGANELDMMQRIVTILGMPPDTMISKMKKNHQRMFFEKEEEGWWAIKQTLGHDASQMIIPSHDPIASLKGAISSACAGKKKPQELREQYDDFVDMIFQMLSYEPKNRLRPGRALNCHPFITKYGS